MSEFTDLPDYKEQMAETAKAKKCDHCYCRRPQVWMGIGPAPEKCCKCGDERVNTHGKLY